MNSFDFYLDVTDLILNPNLSKVIVKWKIFIFCPNFLQVALLNPFNFSDFKSVLRFGMGRTVWICTWNLQMDRQTDIQTYSSNYIYKNVAQCQFYKYGQKKSVFVIINSYNFKFSTDMHSSKAQLWNNLNQKSVSVKRSLPGSLAYYFHRFELLESIILTQCVAIRPGNHHLAARLSQ